MLHGFKYDANSMATSYRQEHKLMITVPATEIVWGNLPSNPPYGPVLQRNTWLNMDLRILRTVLLYSVTRG